jgi:uncharacterized Tic20 family protein
MSVADEIQKLQSLRESGALSEPEFEAAKARLLSGAAPPPMSAQAYTHPAAPLAVPVDPEASTRQWAMFIHLSILAGFLVPGAGLVAPIVLWQIKKNELPGIDIHGCHATNFVITWVILSIICIPLIFVLIGIPLLIILGILGVIFPIIAGIKASNGEVWSYPMTFTFVRPQSQPSSGIAPPEERKW